MATYDMPRAYVMDDLAPSVSGYLASRIQAAIDAGAGAKDSLSIVSDFVFGAAVPQGTDIVIVRPGEAGMVSVPSHVGAILFSGSAGAQVALGVDAAIAIQMTDADDSLSVITAAEARTGTVISVNLGAGDDIFLGAETARNHVVGGAGNDRMTGGARNDQFDVGQGSDTVDGGDGYDRAFVHGSIDDYRSEIGDDGSLRLIDKTSGEITTLSGVEFLTFEDGAVMLNVATESSFVAASLYEVILGRGADAIVHEYLSDTDTARLIDAAGSMLGSPEFSAKFGPVSEMTDTTFLEIMYATAFERQADEEGLQHWLDRLASGMSRGEVAVHFAGSAEAHAEFAATINIIDKDHFG